MDLAEKYAYEIYKENSFSKAAEKLFISQSSLSITIKKLEKKLGFCIFDRSISPIALSREGKIYIEYLEELIENEKIMYNRIKSLSKPVYEQLTIGNAFFISRYILPRACKAFYREFPDVEVRLDMCETNLYSSLLEKIDTGVLQLVIGFGFDEKRHTGVPLLKERYVVCLKNSYTGADKLKKYALTRDELLSGNDFPNKIISDYSLFKDIEFLKINSTSIIWHDMSKFLMHCPLSPCQFYHCRNIDVIYDMMLYGLGAAISTESVVAYHPPADDVLYFLIDVPNPSRQSYIIHKKDVPLSKSAEAFIKILCETSRSLKEYN